jgi:cytochrome c556
MKKIAAAVVACTTLLAAGSVFAQAKPEQLVKQRQAAFTVLAKYFGPMGAMANGKAPYNAEVVKRNAAYVAMLAKMPWDGFAENTKDVKSRALPAIYEDAAKFKAAAERLETETAKLASIVASGSEGDIKGQIKATAKTCGGCHNDFRAK